MTSISSKVGVTQPLLTRPNLWKVLPSFSAAILTSLPVYTHSTYSTGYPRFPGALVPHSLGWCQSAVSIVRRTPRHPYPSRAQGSYKCSSHTTLSSLWYFPLFPHVPQAHPKAVMCISHFYFPVYTHTPLMSASVICSPSSITFYTVLYAPSKVIFLSATPLLS